ncbi:hypothetical protein BLA29_014963, partial [Euroglyphus maynei]
MIDDDVNQINSDYNNHQQRPHQLKQQQQQQQQHHEPLSQVLVTLKDQNQNLIKEVEDLRIKLEDAE